MTAFLSDPQRNLYGTPMVMDMVMGNTEDAFTNILYIMTPAMFSDDPAAYEPGDEENPAIAVNRQLCEYMLRKLGCSESEAKELFDKAMDFERGFLPGMEAMEKKMEGKGAADIFSQRFTTDEIRDMYKNYPLCEIYKALGFDLDGHLVGIMMPEVIGCIDAQYTDENLDKLKAWVLTHTVTEFTNYCDRETFAETTLLQAPMTGIDTLPPDEVYAMKTITALVPSLVDEVYVEYCFDKSIKPQIYDLTVMMIDAFREMLREEDWLSDTTKAAAIDKLDNIKINVCYPDNLPDVGSLTIKSAEEGGTLFDAIKAARIFGRGIAAEVVQRRNDGTYWKFDNYYSTLAACYVPTENSINVFAGICGGDYYQADWPLEKKLGGVCMVVGHEITHAFDDLGATFDKDGNYKDWWAEEDTAKFHERVLPSLTARKARSGSAARPFPTSAPSSACSPSRPSRRTSIMRCSSPSLPLFRRTRATPPRSCPPSQTSRTRWNTPAATSPCRTSRSSMRPSACRRATACTPPRPTGSRSGKLN